MTLFEINKEIESLIDFSTGEILDAEKLESLQMDKHEKLRNIAFVALNAETEIKALKEQEDKFKTRRQAKEKTLLWARETLERELAGTTMKEAEFVVSYNPPSVEIDNFDALPSIYKVLPPPKAVDYQPDKKALLAALKDGKEVPGCHLRRTVKVK